MFAAFKTRGFGLEASHLERPDRMARLILVMALALFWAVSTGMWDIVHHATPDEKSPGRAASQPAARPDVVLQARHPSPSGVPAAPDTTATTVECVAELMGGKHAGGRPAATKSVLIFRPDQPSNSSSVG
jgi:hypothetical protein